MRCSSHLLISRPTKSDSTVEWVHAIGVAVALTITRAAGGSPVDLSLNCIQRTRSQTKLASVMGSMATAVAQLEGVALGDESRPISARRAGLPGCPP